MNRIYKGHELPPEIEVRIAVTGSECMLTIGFGDRQDLAEEVGRSFSRMIDQNGELEIMIGEKFFRLRGTCKSTEVAS